MRYGFILDQRKCIGCHACTVACKQENGVALGNFRTWVKYTEKGSFPHVRRSFLVERCNHCDDAPCVAICPVTALWRRDDGIVDFSSERCIGCKSCMAACPYDAIYIDPDSHTIGKCNYCSHRVDIGLQPACVNVCPVEAIVTGDLDNPSSRISQLLAEVPSAVRRPEKGTQPKVFYLGADEAALNAEATSERSTYMMGAPDPDKPIRLGTDPMVLSSGMVQRDYAVSHQQPWGWHVAAYLWTKSIAAGVFLVAAVLFLLGHIANTHDLLTVAAPLAALVLLGITNGLLVLDLERPERFWRVLLWPHWSSWLVIGAYILAAYGGTLTIELIAGALGRSELFRVIAWPGAVLAIAAAAYTAFLLAQARGRDLWQSPLLPWHLVTQAVVGGSAGLGLLAAVLDRAAAPRIATVLAASLVVSVLLLLSELNLPHVTGQVRRALENLTGGENTARFWLGVLGAGSLLPLVLGIWVATGGPGGLLALAGALALGGLALYENLYIAAGQSVPQS